MKRKSMRSNRWPDWPETKVRPARKLTERHPWMGDLKCWLAQPSILRWWNYNIWDALKACFDKSPSAFDVHAQS